MNKIKFYFDNLSQPCRAVEIFLRATGIPYEPKFIYIAKGENHDDKFEKINPLHKVPVIKDGNFVLTESVAILRYLCRERNVPDHWYPADSRQQAKVDEILEWQHLGNRAGCAAYVWAYFFIPLLTQKPRNPKMLAKAKSQMVEACDAIESVWLNRGHQFIAGEDISIADLVAVTELEQLRLTDYNPCEDRPKLANWMERVRSLTQPHYDIVHKRLLKICQEKNSSDIVSKL